MTNETDDQRWARVLFGGDPAPATPPTTSNTTAPRQARSAADVLFGDAAGVSNVEDTDDQDDDGHDDAGDEDVETTPEPRPAARSDVDYAQVLFGAPEQVAQALDLSDGLQKLASMGATAEQQRAERLAFADLTLNTLGLDRHEAHKWFELMVEQAAKGNLATEGTGDDGFDERTAEWSTRTRQRLAEVYGQAEAEQIERNYPTFINSVPGLRQRLVGGIGAHPDVALALVRSMRRVGRRAV